MVQLELFDDVETEENEIAEGRQNRRIVIVEYCGQAYEVPLERRQHED